MLQFLLLCFIQSNKSIRYLFLHTHFSSLFLILGKGILVNILLLSKYLLPVLKSKHNFAKFLLDRSYVTDYRFNVSVKELLRVCLEETRGPGKALRNIHPSELCQLKTIEFSRPLFGPSVIHI